MTPIEIFVIIFAVDHVILVGAAVYIYFKKYKPLEAKISSFFKALGEISKDYKSFKRSVRRFKKTVDPIINFFFGAEKNE